MIIGKVKELGKYKNGNYTVTIYPDGTKIRETEEAKFVPAFSENVDIQLTDKCSQGCKFCYASCTPKGNHGKIDYDFLKHLHPYTEVALNGNDLDHPQLEELLLSLKKQKVFANITVNQNQFMHNLDKLQDWVDRDLVKGIGVSLITPTENFILEAKKFKNLVVHTIAFVTAIKDYEIIAKSGLKCLVLGYKDKGRGKTYKVVHNIDFVRDAWLYGRLLLDMKFSVLSFDNLALEQLQIQKLIDEELWKTNFMGEDGQFTFFINLVNGTFAKDSCTSETFPINNQSIDEMFNFIRKTYGKD